MKRILTGFAAFALAVMVFAQGTLSVSAMERSYTYNYDYWGDVQDSPDFYTMKEVYTSTELGLDKVLKSPQGLFAKDNLLFICDTGNNRIIEMERLESGALKIKRYIEEIKGDVEIKTLAGPTDVALSEEGNLFIADKGNARILKVDNDLNLIRVFGLPNDSTIDASLTFQPNKLAVDTAERVYCIATGINKGLLKYEEDGTFSGFVGATQVSYNFTDYLWKKFATQEQREKMISFVPTEYENIYMDYEGFIYACIGSVKEEDLKADTVDAVRKLNLMGNDILVRNGDYPVYGDLYMGTGGGISGPSRFTDVSAMDNDVYVCLDKNRGRIFGYNDQGELVFAFGGIGNMNGYFRMPTAIEHIGRELYILDSLDNSLSVFVTTEFGDLVYDAMEKFDVGEYDESEAAWRKAKDLNGNYNLAYIGIGRALLRQEQYKEAMEYFELKYDAENYSKAFKQYRKEWVEENIVLLVVVILAIFLIPLGIGKVKSIKREIDNADIFKEIK